jgi:ribosomal protein S14
MPTCKICNRPITGKGKTGLCQSCVHKTGHRVSNMSRLCELCGDPIADWNETGVCRKCWRSNDSKRGGGSNVPKQKPRVRIICFKCKKLFYAKANQHPKYSMCKRCKEVNSQICTDSRWTNDSIFSEDMR